VAYTLTFSLALGTSQTGLTLEAQLIDTTGVDVGAAITTGFYEAGLGNYTWTGSIPDSHRGGVKFRVAGGGTLKAVAAVNPEEAENTDSKTSTRSSHSAADVWAVGTRTLTAFAFAVDVSATAVALIWDKATSALTTVGSIGKRLADNLDATVSSRLATSSYTAPPSAATIAAAVWDYLTSAATTVGSLGKLLVDNLNATISSRLASASYTAPDNATIGTISSALTTAAANVATILGKLSGITLLGNWLRLVMRKSGGDATALSEVGGTFDNTTDSLEALRDHGDVAWISGTGTGGGANQVTLTFLDEDAAPIIGAAVTIKNSGQTAVVAGPVQTDSLGQAVFALDNGSYKMLVRSTTAFTPLAPQTLTVAGTTTASYELVAFTPPIPTNAGTCVVYGYLLKKSGAVAPNVTVSFEVVAKHGLMTATGHVVAQATVVTATTDSSGYFTAELIRSASLTPIKDGESTDYLVTSPAANLHAQITVPSAASVDFQTLL
jgi:hypothetical protein